MFFFKVINHIKNSYYSSPLLLIINKNKCCVLLILTDLFIFLYLCGLQFYGREPIFENDMQVITVLRYYKSHAT